ncbi:MAG: hypothetical protein QOK40_510 [Miltoncostaeaceae bacterium]|jgi:hypothetical protein|nr:hypothetical protein [Miltoncostaeaceae bacterium]
MPAVRPPLDLGRHTSHRGATIAPASGLRIPVSCVEQGRWHSVSGDFQAAPHASHPGLRRRRAVRLSEGPLSVSSATGAAAEMFRERGADPTALRERFPLGARAARRAHGPRGAAS